VAHQHAAANVVERCLKAFCSMSAAGESRQTTVEQVSPQFGRRPRLPAARCRSRLAEAPSIVNARRRHRGDTTPSRPPRCGGVGRVERGRAL
jgi:hypothetical protein